MKPNEVEEHARIDHSCVSRCSVLDPLFWRENLPSGTDAM